MQLKKRNLVHDWGINDADYNVVTYTEEGKQKLCPYYSRWKDMVQRGHNQKFKLEYPTYTNASVSSEWKRFSVFRGWMESQVWEGLYLDKDILVKGNKIYSPETCVFVPSLINNIVLTGRESKLGLPLGVVFERNSKINPYLCFCPDIKSEKSTKYRKAFSDPMEAHREWQWLRAEYIEQVVAWYASQNCFRTDVAEALTSRVWQLRIDYATNKETKDL